MNVLFIGGTGIISTACTELAVARGLNVTLLNRSQRAPIAGAKILTADISDPAAAAKALAGKDWDSVVDFIAFTPPTSSRASPSSAARRPSSSSSARRAPTRSPSRTSW
jgi:nucleoside-diphosphate-sugar epimerase